MYLLKETTVTTEILLFLQGMRFCITLDVAVFAFFYFFPPFLLELLMQVKTKALKSYYSKKKGGTEI